MFRTQQACRHALASLQVCKSPRVNRSDLDLGWGQVQSSRSAEVPVLIRHYSWTTSGLIRGILLSGDAGPEGRTEKQRWARPGGGLVVVALS